MIFFVVSISWDIENFGENSGENSGKFEKFRELSFCNFSDLTKRKFTKSICLSLTKGRESILSS